MKKMAGNIRSLGDRIQADDIFTHSLCRLQNNYTSYNKTVYLFLLNWCSSL